MVSFPYHSHIFRDSYGSGMGIVWEAYHKGVPSLGVPENPTDCIQGLAMQCMVIKLSPNKYPIHGFFFSERNHGGCVK